MARKTIIAILNIDKQDEADGIGQPVIPRLDYSFITRFYTPLALTSILSLGVHPFVTFFMGRSAMPIESLAVLPVVNSLVFIFRSMGLSYQEVNIALVGERKQNYKSLRSFALILGIAVTLLLGIVAFTPLSRIWFIKISGLTTELAPLAYLPLKILILLPALSVLLSFQRSTLVVSRQTKPISIATAVELGGIIIVLAVCIGYFNMVGVVAAALAYILGKAASTIYLSPIQISSVKSWNLK
jgi:Na+-driven multidrug efflux pump